MAKNLWQDDKMTPSKYGTANDEYGWRAPKEYVTKLEQHRDLTDEMIHSLLQTLEHNVLSPDPDIREYESVVEELVVDIKRCNDSFKEISNLSIKAHLEVSLLQRELGRRTKWLGTFVTLTVALILATIYHFITHA